MVNYNSNYTRFRIFCFNDRKYKELQKRHKKCSDSEEENARYQELHMNSVEARQANANVYDSLRVNAATNNANNLRNTSQRTYQNTIILWIMPLTKMELL